MNIRSAASVMVLAAAMVAGLGGASEADARERRARAEVQTERGVYQGEATTTRGKGFRNRNATVTGPNGGSTGVSDQRAWDRAAGTASHDRTRTFGDGSTRTVEADAQKTGEGTFAGARTVTGRNGETRSQTIEGAVTKTENGRSVDAGIQTQNRGQIDLTKEVTRTEGGRAVSSTATFEDGSTATRSTATACAAGEGCTTTGAFTGRDGRTVSTVETRARTDEGYAKDRTTTFPDGSTRNVSVDAAGNGDGTGGSFTRSATGRTGETRTQTGTVSVTRAP